MSDTSSHGTGLVIGAPSTGSGKTTVVCALGAALKRRGVDVRLFKAGPDYLDPSWHQAVTGRPGRNLDGWMTGLDGVRDSLARGGRGGQLALIEGMMGLFDGRDPTTLEGSAAELAVHLALPVVLVVDASGMARTAAAVVEGLARHVPGVRVAAVIFNQVGGPGHTQILAEAMAPTGIPVLGGLPRRPDLAIPERHLGLVSAGNNYKPEWISALADLAEAHLDLDLLLTLGGPLPEPPALPQVSAAVCRIGVARDEATHFYYADNLELLAEAGAEIVPFSPLHDPHLPAVDGLYLGGGYPELYAAQLSSNTTLLDDLRRFRGPVYAECGGLMLLGEALDGLPMAGLLPLRTVNRERLVSLGYREVSTVIDTILGPAGTTFKGHEFHHSELEAPPPLQPAYTMTGWRGSGVEGWSRGRVLGSYVHAHFGSNPSLAPALVRAAVEARDQQ